MIAQTQWAIKNNMEHKARVAPAYLSFDFWYPFSGLSLTGSDHLYMVASAGIAPTISCL